MSVKMSYGALNSGILQHISQTSSGINYYCPVCKNPVHPKKGKKNAHHFAHAIEKNCSYTPETVLHFEAKHYLVEAIKGNIEAPFLSFPFSSLSDLIKKVSSLLQVEPKHTVSFLDIGSFYMKIPTAEVEKSLGPYLVDVLMKDKRYIERHLAIEILVTHESEKEKIAYFKSNFIPFLELKPIRDSEGHFSFDVHNYFLPEFFSSIEKDYEKKLSRLIYKETKPLLYEELDHEMSEIEKTRMKIKAVQALKKRTENMSLVDSFGTAEKSGYTYMEARASFEGETQLIQMMGIEKVWTKQKTLSLIVNGQYWINNVESQYFEIVNLLLNNFAVDVRVGRYKNSSNVTVQGIGVHLPSAESWEREAKRKIERILDGFEKAFEKELKKQTQTLTAVSNLITSKSRE